MCMCMLHSQTPLASTDHTAPHASGGPSWCGDIPLGMVVTAPACAAEKNGKTENVQSVHSRPGGVIATRLLHERCSDACGLLRLIKGDQDVRIK